MEIISIFIGSMALIIVIWQRLVIKVLEKLIDEHSKINLNTYEQSNDVILKAYDEYNDKLKGVHRRLEELERWQKVVSEDYGDKCYALEGKTKTLEADSTNIWNEFKRVHAEIEGLKPKLAQEEVEKSKDMQLAEQWDNVINFNPLKDLEVTRGN